MSALKDLILKVGEPWSEIHEQDLGLESAERVADFYNNGGLEFYEHGLHFALQYAAVIDGHVEIGAWVWLSGEDFDLDATFEVFDAYEFSAHQLNIIYNRIKGIYGAH